MSDLLDITRQLSDRVSKLDFAPPVHTVYNPLDYAWELHEQYLRRFGQGPKEAVFLGMNPGPWGMAQTGLPFGEIAAVRDWMGITGSVSKPEPEHPRRPVQGLDCPRSEVSGRRLWGWVAERFGTADAFFDRFYVINYCPLVFMEESGRNYTPNKLLADEREGLEAACDEALQQTVALLDPELVIGVGVWADQRARAALKDQGRRHGRILHPSPASPAANRGWAPQAEKGLAKLGVELPG